MVDLIELGSEFFEGLLAADEAIVEQVARRPCRDCGGRLYRGDYPRKPRGGILTLAPGLFEKRFSLCCGREGCRHRATPPSVRFLGRRVYLGAVVIAASAVAVVVATAQVVVRATGVPARTVRRWARWWRGSFTASAPFIELSARLLPAPDRRSLPASLLERFGGESAARVGRLLVWLAPLTTTSCPQGSHFLRVAM